MLIASRCLLGKEVRENMHGEVSSLLRELIGGLRLVSMFIPYVPIPVHRAVNGHERGSRRYSPEPPGRTGAPAAPLPGTTTTYELA
ncbi:hypothetical protein ACP70R_015610 [Stipagrostis hirtigluma subsp. patula]